MAAVVVTADNERLNDAETETHWGTIGGGAGVAVTTEFKYQDASCIARKAVSTGRRGFFHLNTTAITSSSIANPTVITCAANHELKNGDDIIIAGHVGSTPALDGTHVVTVTGATTFTIPVDVTVAGTGGTANRRVDIVAGANSTIMFKVIVTTPGLLDTLANDGLELAIGDDDSNFYSFIVHGSDTYPIRSSWLIIPIDPNIVAHRDATTGTPDLTIANYFATEYDVVGTSNERNIGLDAVDAGSGLTLVGGDGGDTDGVWADFVALDEGNSSNRYGFVTSFEGFIFIVGMMTIGTASATVFNDTGITIVFSDGLFAQGFSGITVDLQSATTDVDWIDSNFFGKGSATGEETRPVLTVVGTSGDFDAAGCVFDAFDVITLTSACTLLNCTASNCLSMLATSATLTGLKVFGATTGDGVAFIKSSNLSNISNCDFTFSDGHAIEITATGTYTFTGNKFNGYGTGNDAAIFNNSGGLVTINVGGGGDTPTIRNGVSASTVVNNNITVTFDTMKDNTEVRIFAAGTSTELAGIENATAGSTDNRNFAAAIAASTSVDYVLHSVLYETIRVDAFTWPTTDQTINVNQRLDRNYENP